MNYDYSENVTYHCSIMTGIIGTHESATNLDFDFEVSFNEMLPFASFSGSMGGLALFVTGYSDLRQHGGSPHE